MCYWCTTPESEVIREAEDDIPCWKIMRIHLSFANIPWWKIWVKPKLLECRSLVFKYRYDEILVKSPKQELKIDKLPYLTCGRVGEGYHSFSTLGAAKCSSLCQDLGDESLLERPEWWGIGFVKCIIPKGAKYMYNYKQKVYVSETIVITPKYHFL